MMYGECLPPFVFAPLVRREGGILTHDCYEVGGCETVMLDSAYFLARKRKSFKVFVSTCLLVLCIARCKHKVR